MPERHTKPVKKGGTEKREESGAKRGKGQSELTPEQLAKVTGGYSPKNGIVGPQDNPE